MQIDTGDYFVVTRGFKLGDSFATTLFRQPQETVKEDRYSRDHVGLVYHAVEVCHDVVAAKLVFDARPPSNYRTEVGAVISLHLDE